MFGLLKGMAMCFAAECRGVKRTPAKRTGECERAKNGQIWPNIIKRHQKSGGETSGPGMRLQHPRTDTRTFVRVPYSNCYTDAPSLFFLRETTSAWHQTSMYVYLFVNVPCVAPNPRYDLTVGYILPALIRSFITPSKYLVDIQQSYEYATAIKNA